MATMVDEFDYSNTTDSELRSAIAVLTLLSERAKKAVDSAKSEAMRRDIATREEESVTVNGIDLGTLRMVKGSVGSLKVSDPLAYAQALANSGYESMTEQVLYPREEAFAKSFLEARVKEELFDTATGELVKTSGELIDGVTRTAGRAESLTYKKNYSTVKTLFENLPAGDVVKLIAPPVEE